MGQDMRRLQLFEFNEVSWLPDCLRALITDYLVCLNRLTRAFFLRLPLLAQAMRHSSRPDRVIDLCSGSGGPWHHLAARLDRMFPHAIKVILTDLYPDNRREPATIGPRQLQFLPDPIDATNPQHQVEGLQTLFNAFHQFPPDRARQVLGRAVTQHQPIAVMELLQRRWAMLPLILLTPLMVLVLTPFIRPFRWSRLALTYLVPIAPVLITWDSLVSWLRCYRPDELLDMARSLDAAHYHWEAGSYWYRGAPVTYLVGYPATEALSADGQAGVRVGPGEPRPVH
ncbi:MAG: class I SAM-dependent methyltransferase [Wenzhouxiangella sp.]|nr:MAG: class I SAM-dependent methyltransferase [Wenzhouxiangella sp.]